MPWTTSTCSSRAKVLSVGEQQRIAFARILLTKPKAVFLDESTSALDEGLEFTLYELVPAELPEMIFGQRKSSRDGRAVPRPPSRARRRYQWRLDTLARGS